MHNVYERCPVYQSKEIALKQTTLEDASELLNCYSDRQSVPHFNSDNCPSNFFCSTVEEMQDEIRFWNLSYAAKDFVRWTAIRNDTGEKIGTIEMFKRPIPSTVGSHGVLRIDLRSDQENATIIRSIVEIANSHFYYDFKVDTILTKYFPTAHERNEVLKVLGYKATLFELKDYLGRRK